MPKRRYLELDAAKRKELEQVRDKHPKAYMREKACALLKVADGMSGHAVAKQGILKPRDPDTVYAWIKRYESSGIEGLLVGKGRGRNPSFSP